VFKLQSGAGSSFVRLGREVGSERFVRAAESVVAKEGALGLRQLTAEDGSAMAVGWSNASLARDCQPVPTREGIRCITSPAYGQWWWSGPSYFDETDCMSEVLVESPCEPPAYALSMPTASQYRVDEVAPVEEPRLTLSENVAACVEQARSWNDGQLYVHTREVAYSQFPELLPAPTREARLTAHWLTTPDGSIVMGDEEYAADLYDSEYEQRCSLRVAADGAMRCLPDDFAGGSGYYSDSRCRDSLITKSATEPREPRYALGEASDDEGNVIGTSVHELGPDYTGPVWTKVYGGDEVPCEPAEVSFDLRSLGSELPADSFVRYDLVDQP
jgi:hypothetical protein